MNIFTNLISIKYPNVNEFISQLYNEESPVWGAGGACREYARDLLSKDYRWYWLAYRIDDFAFLVEHQMRKKLTKWEWNSYFGKGAFSRNLSDTATLVAWLQNRFISEMKNLFDCRYKNSVDPSHIISYESRMEKYEKNK